MLSVIAKNENNWIKYELLVDSIADWCYEKFGESKFQEYLPWTDVENDSNLELKGEYDGSDNTIIIYSKYIDNIDDLISTVIHEYTHYLQSPGWYTRYANTLNKNDDHPYESQAESVAKSHTKKCKQDLHLTNKHLPKLIYTSDS
jgi:hypothetical protein